MNNLGSAGCRNSDGSLCSFCEKMGHGVFCKKHWLDLDVNWSGEPYRATVCCCDAMQDGWSKIIKTKK